MQLEENRNYYSIFICQELAQSTVRVLPVEHFKINQEGGEVMGLERIEPLDWRYSAAIVGLKEYLTWCGASDWKLQDEYLEYNRNLLQSQII